MKTLWFNAWEKTSYYSERRFKPIPSPTAFGIPHKRWESQRDLTKTAADHSVSSTSLQQRKESTAPRLGFTGGTLSNSNMIVLEDSFSNHWQPKTPLHDEAEGMHLKAVIEIQSFQIRVVNLSVCLRLEEHSMWKRDRKATGAVISHLHLQLLPTPSFKCFLH